jgi:hypothetical protein
MGSQVIIWETVKLKHIYPFIGKYNHPLFEEKPSFGTDKQQTKGKRLISPSPIFQTLLEIFKTARRKKKRRQEKLYYRKVIVKKDYDECGFKKL